jgi:hypothetical protein
MSKVKYFVMAGLIATTLLAAAGPRASASVADGRVPAGGVLRVKVPEAIGGKTVIGQLVRDIGYVTAYGCADGMPNRSDLNYVGTVSPVASNRLIVKADNNGEVCFYTVRPAALIVDVNAVTFDTASNRS